MTALHHEWRKLPRPLIGRAAECVHCGATGNIVEAELPEHAGLCPVRVARRIEAQAAEVERLRTLVCDVLDTFVHRGHPGKPCVRSDWVSEDRYAEWRRHARTPLSDEAQAARRPPPPGEVAQPDAEHIPLPAGQSRAAKTGRRGGDVP